MAKGRCPAPYHEHWQKQAARQSSNQSMKPTAPPPCNFRVFATTPAVAYLFLLRSMRCLALISAVATLGVLAVRADTNRPQTPRLRAGADTDVLICWFVESDGRAHHGYAAQDARLDSISPEGGGLFSTRADFEAALGKLQLERLAAGRPRTTLETGEYPGTVPTGWKIRALTAAELKQLRGY